jgi:aminoglycoside 3-N-acetyltransferase
MAAVSRVDIAGAIRSVGLSGRPVCVHSSLRSFGWVDGGADAVIDAALDEGCTLMVPTHSYFFAVGPPPGRLPEHNGWEHDGVEDWPGSGRIFTVDSDEVSTEMGAIPAAVLRRIGRVRGDHPIDSLAATGPLAAELIGVQTPSDVQAPFERLCALGGRALLMGVGLESLTLLHYAEQVAGRRPFIRWANGPDAQAMEVRTGSCSDGFPKLDGALGGVEQRVSVGESLWRVFPAAAAVKAAVNAITANPSITRCERADCERCRDALLGGPPDSTRST